MESEIVPYSSRGDSSASKSFEKNERISLTMDELLRLGGVQLSDVNVDSGGLSPEESNNTNWPLFRLTGVALQINLELRNFRRSAPFDRTPRLSARVSAQRGVWSSLGQLETYKEPPNSSLSKLLPYERYPQVIEVSFQSTGEVGKASAATTLLSIAVAASIFGVAAVVLDNVALLLVTRFSTMRETNRNDWLVLESVKEKAIKDGTVQDFAKKHGFPGIMKSELRDPTILDSEDDAFTEEAERNSQNKDTGKPAKKQTQPRRNKKKKQLDPLPFDQDLEAQEEQ